MNRLNGLVLAGGQSLRMGKDKGQITYHGQPQSIYLYNLVRKLCGNTYLSIREDQKDLYADTLPTITDRNVYRGPFNGILSAHEFDPEASWLVVACDLPLMDLSGLRSLIAERDTRKDATAMATRKTGLPEPLAAIWEAGTLEKVPSYLENTESSCPRKYLLNSDIKLVFPTDDTILLNSNSEEDYKEVMKILSTA